MFPDLTPHALTLPHSGAARRCRQVRALSAELATSNADSARHVLQARALSHTISPFLSLSLSLSISLSPSPSHTQARALRLAATAARDDAAACRRQLMAKTELCVALQRRLGASPSAHTPRSPHSPHSPPPPAQPTPQSHSTREPTGDSTWCTSTPRALRNVASPSSPQEEFAQVH